MLRQPCQASRSTQALCSPDACKRRIGRCPEAQHRYFLDIAFGKTQSVLPCFNVASAIPLLGPLAADSSRRSTDRSAPTRKMRPGAWRRSGWSRPIQPLAKGWRARSAAPQARPEGKFSYPPSNLETDKMATEYPSRVGWALRLAMARQGGSRNPRSGVESPLQGGSRTSRAQALRLGTAQRQQGGRGRRFLRHARDPEA